MLGFETRGGLDGFLKARGVFEEYTLDDLEQERRDIQPPRAIAALRLVAADTGPLTIWYGSGDLLRVEPAFRTGASGLPQCPRLAESATCNRVPNQRAFAEIN